MPSHSPTRAAPISAASIKAVSAHAMARVSLPSQSGWTRLLDLFLVTLIFSLFG